MNTIISWILSDSYPAAWHETQDIRNNAVTRKHYYFHGFEDPNLPDPHPIASPENED